jgi:hypothetical protein
MTFRIPVGERDDTVVEDIVADKLTGEPARLFDGVSPTLTRFSLKPYSALFAISAS